MSLLFGASSVVLGVGLFLQPEGDGRWFVLSTVGLSAIGLGLHARRLWRTGCATAGRLPKLAVWLGVIGTVIMLLHALIVTGFLSSVQAPDLRAPAAAEPRQAGSDASDVPAGSPTKMELAQVAGTIAFVLSRTHGQGPWPTELVVDASGSVFALDDPTVALVQLPAGTTLDYVPSADLRGYTVRLTAANDPAVSASFDTGSGAVATS